MKAEHEAKPRAASRARWVRWWPALAIAVAFATGWIGSGVWSSGFGTNNFRPGEQFEGTVTLVNQDGSAVCIAKEPDERQRCSGVFQLVGSPILHVGDRVSVASGIIWPRGQESGIEVFIVTVPPPDAVDAGDPSQGSTQ